MIYKIKSFIKFSIFLLISVIALMNGGRAFIWVMLLGTLALHLLTELIIKKKLGNAITKKEDAKVKLSRNKEIVLNILGSISIIMLILSTSIMYDFKNHSNNVKLAQEHTTYLSEAQGVDISPIIREFLWYTPDIALETLNLGTDTVKYVEVITQKLSELIEMNAKPEDKEVTTLVVEAETKYNRIDTKIDLIYNKMWLAIIFIAIQRFIDLIASIIKREPKKKGINSINVAIE